MNQSSPIKVAILRGLENVESKDHFSSIELSIAIEREIENLLRNKVLPLTASENPKVVDAGIWLTKELGLRKDWV